MSANTHFTIAVHILTWMALVAEHADDLVTSEQIARSVNTNAVFIRRILGQLNRAGLVTVQRGPDAGWRLARPAGAITLRDVHAAVSTGPLFRLHQSPPNPACPVGAGIQPLLRRRYAGAQAAMEAELAHTTIRDLATEVREGQRAGLLPIVRRKA
jgi:Rrf2 family protein